MSPKKIIFITIIISLLSITVATFYKVKKEHSDKVVLVTEKRILYGAQNCVFDGACKEKKVTLGTLIQKGYVKEEVNPLTKMYYSPESFVEINEDTYIFKEVR